MKLDHIAIWVEDLEKMKNFYLQFFDCKCSEKYINPAKNFQSYFLTFKDLSKIELMHNPKKNKKANDLLGYAHLAIRLKTKKEIDILTEKIKQNGYKIVSGPRVTGDGYYETSFLDPESNIIEITKRLKR